MKPGYPKAVAVLLLVLLTALAPRAVRAQAGSCILPSDADPRNSMNGGSENSLAGLCDQPDSVQTFYIYARSDVALADLPDLLLDFRILSSTPYLFCGDTPPPLPPFWLFWTPDATCNADALYPVAATGSHRGYRSLWDANHVAVYQGGGVRSNTEGIYFVDFVPRTGPFSMEANRIYFVGTLQLAKCASGPCSGCDASVVLEMRASVCPPVGGPPGYCNGKDLGLSSVYINVYGVCSVAPPYNPAELSARAGHPSMSLVPPVATRAFCDPVPVKRRTWGSLKTLYR